LGKKRRKKKNEGREKGKGKKGEGKGKGGGKGKVGRGKEKTTLKNSIKTALKILRWDFFRAPKRSIILLNPKIFSTSGLSPRCRNL